MNWNRGHSPPFQGGECPRFQFIHTFYGRALTSRLFESEFLSRREQTDRFAYALLARFRPLRRMNPGDEVATIAGCQFLKELPGLGVLLKGLGDVVRQIGDGRFWGVGIVRWCRGKAGRREQVCRLELSPPFSIWIRPLTGGLSGRHLYGVSIVIEAFD